MNLDDGADLYFVLDLGQVSVGNAHWRKDDGLDVTTDVNLAGRFTKAQLRQHGMCEDGSAETSLFPVPVQWALQCLDLRLTAPTGGAFIMGPMKNRCLTDSSALALSITTWADQRRVESGQGC